MMTHVLKMNGAPSRDEVRIFLEAQGFTYLGPMLPEDDPGYQPPPPDPYEIAAIECGALVGFYRVRRP